MDGAALEKFGGVRRSPRIQTPQQEKRKYVDSDEEKPSGKKRSNKKKRIEVKCDLDLKSVNGKSVFVGDPVPEEEAKEKWPHRYAKKASTCYDWHTIADTVDDDDIILSVKCHYLQANVNGCIFELGDCAYVKGEEKKPNYVGKILEFFETIKGEYYVRLQWFYRAQDTVMKEQAAHHDKKRLFYSDLTNDNLLDSIVSKVRVVHVPISPHNITKLPSSPDNDVELKKKSLPSCYYYYDMKYSVDHSTFQTMKNDNLVPNPDLASSDCSGVDNVNDIDIKKDGRQLDNTKEEELSLLDLYAGCGGMSTGLCLGAQCAGVNLVARWAVDFEAAACQSLRLNHPKTQVRNEAAGDFYELLKEWDKLCKKYIVKADEKSKSGSNKSKLCASRRKSIRKTSFSPDEYVVSKLIDICYGDPSESGEHGLKFKVRWEGYDPSEDTWEPIKNLSNCEDKIRDFVAEGYASKLLPLPGNVDVLCGGPPCQGISGYNRFRNFEAPLEDEKNQQIVVFMDIVEFLKPRYVLMENVVDILKFAGATLGRYGISRLVHMNYQVRLGMMAAGCYGLPQFRLRAFLWGCHPSEKLPQFPLPTHETILKGGAPVEFVRSLVGYEEGQPRSLLKEVVLRDVLTDLPAVTNKEDREQMLYELEPQNDFQTYIRKSKSEFLGLTVIDDKEANGMLYDHRPLRICNDDYLRVCRIPKRKGANLRDLPGIAVDSNNKIQFDPTMERELLPSGKPLIPDWSMNLWEGKSLRPYSRLWWDEIVPTVLTVPDHHSQTVLHPEQDRVLTIRESARIQGFPDCYRFCGKVNQRYRQIGNAVAVSVSKALGYTFGQAVLKQSGDGPLLTLPPNFTFSNNPYNPSTSSSEVQ